MEQIDDLHKYHKQKCRKQKYIQLYCKNKDLTQHPNSETVSQKENL